MVYRVFISTDDNAVGQEYERVIKRGLFNLNDTMMPIGLNDLPQDNQRLQAAQHAIAGCQIFIGVYGTEYGVVPPGETRSIAEILYHHAHTLGLQCLIFMPEAARSGASPRQEGFKQHLSEYHVINYFTDAEDLGRKVQHSLDNFKRLRPIMRQKLETPFQNLRSGGEALAPGAPLPPGAPPTADTLEQTIDRALALAGDDIEQIVRRALELHEARTRPTQPQNGMMMNPIFGEPLARSQFRSDIFMIMPFRERFNDIYQNVIQPTTAELNLTIKRGDDFSSISGSIMREVWAALNACRLVIAETSEINANVYYELGIAHTLGKPAILLTQAKEVEELPFDIRHLRFIVYEDTIAGGEKLEEELRKMITWILNDLEEGQ